MVRAVENESATLILTNSAVSGGIQFTKRPRGDNVLLTLACLQCASIIRTWQGCVTREQVLIYPLYALLRLFLYILRLTADLEPVSTCFMSGTDGTPYGKSNILAHEAPEPTMAFSSQVYSTPASTGFRAPSPADPTECWAPSHLDDSSCLGRTWAPEASRTIIWKHAPRCFHAFLLMLFLQVDNNKAPDLPTPPASWDTFSPLGGSISTVSGRLIPDTRIRQANAKPNKGNPSRVDRKHGRRAAEPVGGEDGHNPRVKTGLTNTTRTNPSTRAPSGSGRARVAKCPQEDKYSADCQRE